MAQKIIQTLVSDLSQTEEDTENGVTIETVEFGLDGTDYEMELTGEEAATLREVLAEFKAAARRQSGVPSKRTRKATGPASRPTAPAASSRPAASTPGKRSREETRAIREWARGKGMEVSERGRIPSEVEEAYAKAHPDRQAGGVPKSNNGTSLADAPDADTAPETDGEGTEELSGWQEPTRPLSAVPSLPEGDDPADEAAPAEEEKVNGKDGLTPSRREAIREWAQKQGMEVKAKGILKKELIASAAAWENTHGTLDNVTPAEAQG